MSSLTKIFIVLQLVCSLVLAVVVVSMVSRQEPYRHDLEAAQKKAFGSQALLAAANNDIEALRQQLNNGSTESTKAIDGLKGELDRAHTQIATLKISGDASDAKNAQLQAAVNQLTAAIEAANKQLAAMNTENQKLGPENVSLIQKNAELARTNNELSTSLKFAEQAIRKLQEQVSAMAEKSSNTGASITPNDASTVQNLTVQTPAEINGKITSVSPLAGKTLVQLPLGTRDGVRKGTQFMIYRNQGYIGDAVVDSVYPDTSVATVTTVKKGETVAAGDMVISGASH